MNIGDIINSKGSWVLTLGPDDQVSTLVGQLAERRVGAAVVTEPGGEVLGIVSERDVVQALAANGAGLLQLPVREVMTSDVVTCEPSSGLVELLEVMTERRFRHVPVVVDGQLTGIVSIGDIVKHRLDELRAERDQLEAYIHT